MTVSITTRTDKGSELTYAEVDGNFTSLKTAVETLETSVSSLQSAGVSPTVAAALAFLTPTDVTFATAIPFSGNLFMPQQAVSGAMAFSVAANQVKGAHVYVRLVADGTNIPTFASFKEWGGSAGYDNRAGIVNQIEFWYDGIDFWYFINQAIGATAGDSVAPTASSAAVANSTPTVVAIACSESLDVAYVPDASSFTVSGHAVSSVGISANTISLTCSAAFAYGESARTVSYTQPGSNGARDAAGNLMASFSSLSITNNVAQTASAVTLTGPTSGVNGSASTNFTAGVSPVGGAITGTVVVTPSDSSGGGTFTPTTVSLTTGSPSATFTYTPASTGAKTISVTNNGSLTNPSSITYTVSSSATVPGAPTIGTATAGNTTASVAFTAPGSNGGATITGYTVTSSPGSITATGTTSPISVTGLTNGTAYTFTVHATNSVGNSPESSASNSVTPAVSATVPGQVTGLTLGTATSTTQPLTWTAPASNGGSAITDYVVQRSPAGANTWTTFADGTSTSASATVTGLTASTSYDYRVAAVNAIGTGAYSSTATGSTAAAVASLRFGQLSNVTESGTSPNYVYTATSGAGTASYQGEGILNKTFGTGDAEIIIRIPTKPNELCWGLTTSSTPVSYPGLAYGVWLAGSGNYNQVTGGGPGSGSPGGTWAANDKIRIARVGTTITVARQPDGSSTWTTTNTWTGAPSTAFNIALCLNEGVVVDTLSGSGLV